MNRSVKCERINALPNIETIFTHTSDAGATGELGIDENGLLYWNKKPVVTEQKVKLQGWVNVAAIAAALSTVIIAVFTVLTYYSTVTQNDKYFEMVSKNQFQIESLKRDLKSLKESEKEQNARLEKYNVLIENKFNTQSPHKIPNNGIE